MIILNNNILFEEVTGKIFAPPSFPVYEPKFLSTTGVVSFSLIRKIFPHFDPNMVLSFLQTIEYCYEIQDQYIMEELFKVTNISPNDKYYYFPHLVTVERPPLTRYEYCINKTVQFGWVLKFKKRNFTLKFIQTLLLRLIFGKTKIPNQTTAGEVIASHSLIWKSGLHWFGGNGIGTFVDVVDTAKVVVFMYCESESKASLLNDRAFIMTAVRKLSKTIYPAVSTEEYFVHPCYIKNYLTTMENDDYLIPKSAVCEAFEAGLSHVTSFPSLKIEDILLLDPHMGMCSTHIQCLLNEDQEVPDTIQSIGKLKIF